MKTCLHCGKPFEPKKPKAKFCSAKCRVYYHRGMASDNKAVFDEVSKEVKEAPTKKALPYTSVKMSNEGIEVIKSKEPVSAKVTVRLPGSYLGVPIPDGLIGWDITVWKAEVRDRNGSSKSTGI